MDHRHISDTADSTRAFSIAGAQTSDVSYRHFFSLVREQTTDKISYRYLRPFCSYFGLMSLRLFITSESKKLCFVGKSVFCTV